LKCNIFIYFLETNFFFKQYFLFNDHDPSFDSSSPLPLNTSHDHSGLTFPAIALPEKPVGNLPFPAIPVIGLSQQESVGNVTSLPIPVSNIGHAERPPIRISKKKKDICSRQRKQLAHSNVFFFNNFLY
jgi:hypothetical protein